jgi:hypothetical protein
VTERHEITKKPVRYAIPGMDQVQVRKDIRYKTTELGSLTLDVYLPPDSKAEIPTPAVLFVTGFSDIGAEAFLGCKFKEMESYISWSRLIAMSGMTAITYSTGRDPAIDLPDVIHFIRENASNLGIDAHRIGIWSCSGNVPNALSALQTSNDFIKCTALCYGYMLDLDGSHDVADASQKIGFVNPCAGKSIDDFRKDVPLFLLRAGRDETPSLNHALDRFVASALSRHFPLTLVNYPEGVHAFDLIDDSRASREAIREVLSFLQFHLLDK